MCRLGIRIAGANPDHRPDLFIGALEEARRAGYRAVEIIPDDFDLIVGGRLCEDVLSEVEKILAGFSFDLSVHVPLRLNLFDRERPKLHFQVLRSCAEICERLRAGVLVHHPGRYVDNVDFPRYGKPDEHDDEARKTDLIGHEKFCLSTLAREFSDLMIAMENHRPYADYSPYSYAEFIPELVEVVRDINRPNVRITLDTGHLNLAAAHYGKNALDWAAEARPWVAHTHIHDNHGIVNFFTEKDKAAMLPFGRGDEHNLPGSGTFPFSDFFEIFAGYQGTHLIELTGRYLYPAKMVRAREVVAAFLLDAKAAAVQSSDRSESSDRLSDEPEKSKEPDDKKDKGRLLR